MDKQMISCSVDKEVLNRVREIQNSLVGSSNVSALVERLLIEWIQHYEVQNNG